MGSLNKATLLGRLGMDPEIRSMQSGDRVCNLSLATSESWKDKNTGEKKEKTEWHRVIVFSEGTIGFIEKYMAKGSEILVEGKIETRKWSDQQTGQDKYSTEIIVRGYGDKVILCGKGSQNGNTSEQPAQAPVEDSLEDEIPF